jgi:hypothetical protein
VCVLRGLAGGAWTTCRAKFGALLCDGACLRTLFSSANALAAILA